MKPFGGSRDWDDALAGHEARQLRDEKAKAKAAVPETKKESWQQFGARVEMPSLETEEGMSDTRDAFLRLAERVAKARLIDDLPLTATEAAVNESGDTMASERLGEILRMPYIDDNALLTARRIAREAYSNIARNRHDKRSTPKMTMITALLRSILEKRRQQRDKA